LDDNLASGSHREALIHGLHGAAGGSDDIEIRGYGGAVDDNVEGTLIGGGEVDFSELQFDVVAAGRSGELVLQDGAIGVPFLFVQGGVWGSGDVGVGSVGGAGCVGISTPKLSEAIGVIGVGDVDAHQSRRRDQGGEPDGEVG
jgi:hypothetical protein